MSFGFELPTNQIERADMLENLMVARAIDGRCTNLRNQMAHELLRAQDMTEENANLLLHALFVLGIWKELSEARNPGGQNKGPIADPAQENASGSRPKEQNSG